MLKLARKTSLNVAKDPMDASNCSFSTDGAFDLRKLEGSGESHGKNVKSSHVNVAEGTLGWICQGEMPDLVSLLSSTSIPLVGSSNGLIFL